MTKKNDRAINGDYDVGYCRPPKSGQIKPGEVRNRWGKTGKPRSEANVLLKVAAEEVSALVNGKAATMTQEEGLVRRAFQEAHKNPQVLKLLWEQLNRLRPPLPPVPTPEEIAQQEAEMAERERLAARLVDLLEEEADVGRPPKGVHVRREEQPLADASHKRSTPRSP